MSLGQSDFKLHFSCYSLSGIYDKFILIVSLRKQPTFGDATTGFPAKSRLRNEHRNSIVMTCHYPDLGSASDWLCCVGDLIQPIRSTNIPRSGQRYIVSMEFLCSFLRHHLAGKPVVALPNVSCFLRLINCEKLILHFFHTTILFLIAP